jgi:transcription factor SPN1
MIDNNLLEAVKRWLEPLPDRSLPALNIQRTLFEALVKMEFIDSSVLRESGLGKIVLFYTKCKRVNPGISRIASTLVEAWSRPIIKRSASFRDMAIPVADNDSVVKLDRLNVILAKAKAAEKGLPVRTNAVRIPTAEGRRYTVAPKPNAGFLRHDAAVDLDTERRKRNAERMRALTRKMKSGN